MEQKNVKKVSDLAKKEISGFKEFISKGNVIDLAVGVIIGEAFGKIVSSIVSEILMPVIGIFLGGIDFTSLSVKIKDVTINYGKFLQNIVDFLIIALCVYIFVSIINKIFKKEEKKKVEKPKKSDEVILLEEIRDLLKNK